MGYRGTLLFTQQQQQLQQQQYQHQLLFQQEKHQKQERKENKIILTQQQIGEICIKQQQQQEQHQQEQKHQTMHMKRKINMQLTLQQQHKHEPLEQQNQQQLPQTKLTNSVIKSSATTARKATTTRTTFARKLRHKWRTWTWSKSVDNSEILCMSTATITKTTTTADITKTTPTTKPHITKTTSSKTFFPKGLIFVFLSCVLLLLNSAAPVVSSMSFTTSSTTTTTSRATATMAVAMVATTTAAAAAAVTGGNLVVGNGHQAPTTHETPFASYQIEMDGETPDDDEPPETEPIETDDEEEEDNELIMLRERGIDRGSDGVGIGVGVGVGSGRIDDVELVSVAEVNSNEQQLLAYYQRAQLRKRQHQQQQQQQHQQQQQQQQKLHRHRVRELGVLLPVHTTPHGPPELLTKKGVTKRSATRPTTASATVMSKNTTTNNSTPAATVAATTGSTGVAGNNNVTAPVNATTAGATAAAAAAAASGANVTEEKCVPRVLEDVPSEPFYDFTDIAEDAARQFTDFLSTKFTASASTEITAQIREEVRRRANGIATYALNEDDNLLAFAIAAPSIHTVVVKFRDNVTIPPKEAHNKAFLGFYWRELGYAWNSTDGTQEWGSPFRDCNLLKGRWLWPFRISFTENKFKIVAAAFIAADEDVCNDGLEEVFGRRHGCDRNTTFCLLTENKHPATRDAYTCICRESFYLPNSTLQGFRGDLVEQSSGYDNYSCIPCPNGCANCDQYGVCLLGETLEVVSMESLLNLSVGSILGACILCCIVLSVIVFQQRKCKAIASAMWTVLETILLGIVLLYASVAVHFFPASTERCLLEPWLRELGFITCYGAIILKLYRHLVDFRTRKAHRWVLRDVDLLKYLGTMVFAVICYMGAFTASALDLLQTAQLDSLREVSTNTCQPLKWEYVTQISEVLILCFGLHLSFASRNANTQFRERQFLVATLVLEFLVSSAFYVLRFFYLPEMTPSVIFLALFLRSQFTNTISLGLIFVPKLWYQHRQGPHDAGQRLGGGYAGLCLGDPDIGELTISEMSPEDIRAELKRLYTQLEILKNKTLRQDNPHISKRRGGRKVGHRRFSLQKKGSKDKALSAKHRSNKHHQDIEITEAEPSRTPEDSVCSVEGPTDTYAEISGISHSMYSHSMVSHSIVSHSK